MERVGLDYYGWEPLFTRNWKHQATLTFYEPPEPKASLFDVCSGACNRPLEAEESTLVRAGVLGWTIGDINYVSYLQVCAGLAPGPQ
jgi:hypothetical protein